MTPLQDSGNNGFTLPCQYVIIRAIERVIDTAKNDFNNAQLSLFAETTASIKNFRTSGLYEPFAKFFLRSEASKVIAILWLAAILWYFENAKRNKKVASQIFALLYGVSEFILNITFIFIFIL